jgi:hypothetical protein
MSQKPTQTLANTEHGFVLTLDHEKLQTGQQRTEAVIAVVKSLMQELDLAGYVNASASDHMAHSLEIERPWMKMVMEYRDDGTVHNVRLKSKLADYNGDVNAQRKDLEATLGFLHGMTMTMAPITMMFAEASTRFDEVIKPEHYMVRVGDV